MESLEDILRRLTPENGLGDTGLESQVSFHQSESAPICSICGDLGWVTLDVPVGHEAFGKALQCSCRQRQDDPVRLAQLKRYSNLGHLGKISFANTNPKGRSPNIVDQELFRKSYESGLSLVARSFWPERDWENPFGCCDSESCPRGRPARPLYLCPGSFGSSSIHLRAQQRNSIRSTI